MAEQHDQRQQQRERGNRLIAIACATTVVAMIGMSYAAVPLYELFCSVTGFGGTIQRADAPAGTVLERTIIVRFDANTRRDLQWRFKPAQKSIKVRLGETATAIYVARNTGPGESWGTANFNVSPDIAGVYFNKVECFCFTEQKLAPGERVEMPVVFYVDPELASDPLFNRINTITLSYTMFATEPPEQPVAAAGGSGQSKDNL